MRDAETNAETPKPGCRYCELRKLLMELPDDKLPGVVSSFEPSVGDDYTGGCLRCSAMNAVASLHDISTPLERGLADVRRLLQRPGRE